MVSSKNKNQDSEMQRITPKTRLQDAYNLAEILWDPKFNFGKTIHHSLVHVKLI